MTRLSQSLQLLQLPFLPLLLLLLLSTISVVVDADRTELPSQACTVPDLTHVCPDENVNQEKLESHCLGLHGVPGAKCYFEYVCNHHDQDAVNTHRECIEAECPLVKRMGFYNCSQHVVSYADEEEEYEVQVEESNSDNNEGTVQDDKPSSSGGGGGVTNAGDENDEDENDETSSAGATSPSAPEEVIHEDTVTVPESAKEEEKEKEREDNTVATETTEAPQKEEEGGGKKLLGAVVLVGLGVGLLLFVFRGKIAGWASGNHPGDAEIVNFAPAQNSEMA